MTTKNLEIITSDQVRGLPERMQDWLENLGLRRKFAADIALDTLSFLEGR